MAIRSKEDILNAIKEKFQNDNSDEVIKFLEDVSDTLTDYETRANGDGTDWKAEATRIDKEWREKYKARFFSGEQPEEDDASEFDEIKPKRFEDLFKEE